jgi:hypothetical protein
MLVIAGRVSRREPYGDFVHVYSLLVCVVLMRQQGTVRPGDIFFLKQ